MPELVSVSTSKCVAGLRGKAPVENKGSQAENGEDEGKVTFSISEERAVTATSRMRKDRRRIGVECRNGEEREVGGEQGFKKR